MIKNVFNWSVGSFFRTIGRIIAYIVIGSLIGLILSNNDISISNLFMPKVSALTTGGWAYSITEPLELHLYDCNGETSCNTEKTMYSTYRTDTLRYQFYSDDVTIAQNGVILAYNTGQVLRYDYLYATSVYFCTNTQIFGVTNSSLYSNFFGQRAVNSSTYYSGTNNTSLSIYPYEADVPYGSYCYSVTSTFVPSGQHQWLFLRLRRTSGSYSNVFFYPVGFEIRELGLYTNTVRDIISSVVSTSGLASAQSVEDVQDSVDYIQNEVEELNDQQASTNNILTDDDTSGATNSASNFFSNFTTNTHGLTAIITAPLSAIQSLTNATCSPLVLPLPFVNQNLTLPCMREIYVQNFGAFMTLYDTITFGIIAYWVMVRIFALVKDFKNPEHDEIEVMDL